MVAVHVDEGLFDTREPGFHFAVSGKAFAVITEHFPQLLQKVRTGPLRRTLRFGSNPQSHTGKLLFYLYLYEANMSERPH